MGLLWGTKYSNFADAYRGEIQKYMTPKRLIIIAVALLAIAIGAYMLSNRSHRRANQKPRFEYRGRDMSGVAYTEEDYDGIDVSRHQGVIDWDTVAKDPKIQFVYIKATMGYNHPDPRYEANISEAREAGLKVGSYHFFTSKFSVEKQYRSFREMAKPSEQDLIPMVDVETGWVKNWTKKQLRDSLRKFCRLVERDYGCKPMIYSNEHFYNQMLAPDFNDHILYIASYLHYPQISGNGAHDLWQFTEKGHIHGINEYVDLCRFTNDTGLKDILR